MKIGIEKLRVYPASLCLELGDLCQARGVDPKTTLAHLLSEQRGLNPPWEDPVTMAVNAAHPLLSKEDRDSIELLIVGTETAPDLEKPLSTWVHRYLELPSGCRNFEVKHACYAATAGLQTAAAWLASGLVSPNGKALVIGTDQSLIGIGEPWEYVLGGGAVAMVVSRDPRFLELELGHSGVYSRESSDVIRPTGRLETGNSDHSLFAYLEAVQETYDAWEAKVGEVDFDTHFARNLYHVPFGGITFRAHKALVTRNPDFDPEDAQAHFDRKCLPGLTFNRRMGGTYGASTFVSMLGHLHSSPELKPGDRLGVFAFGSGSCAEFYSAKLGSDAHRIAREANLETLLAARQRVSVEEYESIERERAASWGERHYEPTRSTPDGWYSRNSEGQGRLVLERVHDWFRDYGWS